MSVSKVIDRTNLGSLDGREVAQDDASNLVRAGGREAILIKATRQRSSALELGPATAQQGAELRPSKTMGAILLSSTELAGRGLEKGGASSLKVSTQGRTTTLKEETERWVKAAGAKTTTVEREGGSGKLNEGVTGQARTTRTALCPNGDAERSGRGDHAPKSVRLGACSSTAAAAPGLNTTSGENKRPSSRVNIFAVRMARGGAEGSKGGFPDSGRNTPLVIVKRHAPSTGGDPTESVPKRVATGRVSQGRAADTRRPPAMADRGPANNKRD